MKQYVPYQFLAMVKQVKSIFAQARAHLRMNRLHLLHLFYVQYTVSVEIIVKRKQITLYSSPQIHQFQDLAFRSLNRPSVSQRGLLIDYLVGLRMTVQRNPILDILQGQLFEAIIRLYIFGGCWHLLVSTCPEALKIALLQEVDLHCDECQLVQQIIEIYYTSNSKSSVLAILTAEQIISDQIVQENQEKCPISQRMTYLINNLSFSSNLITILMQSVINIHSKFFKDRPKIVNCGYNYAVQNEITSNYSLFQILYLFFSMGCVSGKPEAHKKQLTQQHTSNPTANNKDKAQISSHQIVDPSANPPGQTYNQKQPQVPEDGGHQELNLSGRPGWTGRQFQQFPATGQTKIDQSPICIIYSSNNSTVGNNKEPIRYRNQIKTIAEQAEDDSQQDSRRIAKQLFPRQQSLEQKRKSPLFDPSSKYKSNLIDTQNGRQDKASGKYEFSTKRFEIGQQQYLNSERAEFRLKRVEIMTNDKV